MSSCGFGRTLALFVALSGACLVPVSSRASVSIAVSWDGLLKESSAAAIVTPEEARSVWENGRIYTYTRVRVDRSVAGDLGVGADAWVRTMGGEVGSTGQSVEGEALFLVGQPSLVFLHEGPVGAFEVTARGQGQFPIGPNRSGPVASPSSGPVAPGISPPEGAPLKVFRSGSVGLLLTPSVGRAPAPQLAGELLHGRTVDDAAREVASAWSRTHAR